MPKVTIITCSFNKPQYVLDAINSVLKQTFCNFEYIILENSSDGKTRKIVHGVADKRVKIIDVDFSDKERNKIYVESRLKNIYFPLANGKYMMSLADDDMLEPTCFEEHLKEFEKDKSQIVNFHACRITYLDSDRPDEILPAVKTFGPHRSPLQRMDGGSIMFKKQLLDKIPQPYFKCNWFDAHISDGLFLNKISREVIMYPINKILHTKRVTKISTHTFIDDDGVARFFRPRRGWEHPLLNIK
jgi:glycosyltransferase involved in cell wall biosynthesis